MKRRFIVQVQILLALASAIILSLITFSFTLIGNVTNAQELSNASSPLLSGIISSLLLDISPYTDNSTYDSTHANPFNITNVPKFILAGDWNIKLDNSNTKNNSLADNLKVVDIAADFVGITTNGMGSHTHQISNFTPISNIEPVIDETNSGINMGSSVLPTANVFNLNGNAHILGTVDVGINNNKIWEDVKANITVSNGKTIEIRLDDTAVGFHFGQGQAIYGLVNGLYSQ